MELNKLELSENRINALYEKGIETVEDLQDFFPRTYEDYSSPKYLSKKYHRQKIAIVGTLEEVRVNKTPTGKLQLLAKIRDHATRTRLHVSWFGAYYMKKIIEKWLNETVVVCGMLEFNEDYRCFCMNNPSFISNEIIENLCIRPIYKKMSGISSDFLKSAIDKALEIPRADFLPDNLVKDNSLIDINKAFRIIHNPSTFEDLDKAKKRIIYGKLFDFVSSIEQKDREASRTSPYMLSQEVFGIIDKYINNLPFELTFSQIRTYTELINKIINGNRINALIQGDVGSGKSVIAFIIALAMSNKGFQSIIMAPTVVLAKQHYKTLQNEFRTFGINIAFLGGNQKKEEKEEIYDGIRSGLFSIIVGTHSLLNNSIEYNNLGLVIIDEEHRFGVKQRDFLMQRAKMGVHCINMSATPIPRTLATSIYGNGIDVYDIELPPNRKPVQTAIFNNDLKIFEFIEKKIREGRQTYVICPWIDSEESGIMTIEDAYKVYNAYFADKPDIKIGVINGRMKDEEIFNIIDEFSRGNIHILISTTVIEVGVNIPNATVMIINNAERFGVSQLHQLRGRVCRGSEPGYCILKSIYKNNPRLQIILNNTNGYKIASEDMNLRGSGNLFGMEQSGKNDYINLILEYPDLYKKVKSSVQTLYSKST